MNMLSAIEIAEKELQRDKDDLKRLKKRYPGHDFIRIESTKNGLDGYLTRQSKTNLSELETAVLATVNSIPKSGWTSRAIYTALKQEGSILPPNEDAALNAIGYALAELRTDEKIFRIHEGKGRDPHLYAAIPTDPIEKEVPEETS